MRYAIYTLGCKVNQYETQAMETILTGRGHTLTEFDAEADVYIINTCSVTAVSDKKCRNMIRRTKRTHPDALIAVCGCYAQAKPEEVAGLEVDLVAGTGDRMAFLDQVEQAALDRSAAAWVSVDNALKRHDFEVLPAGGLVGRTRAMLKVEDGCGNFCTYCIIPFTRGPVRSESIDAAVTQAKALAEAGYHEIVVTGIEISSWGQDLEGDASLIDLLEALCHAVPTLRVRLGSLEPRTITEDFCRRASALANLCPHFHLSLQSGSVADRMPDQLPNAVKDARCHQAAAVAAQMEQRYLESWVGETLPVLFEEEADGLWRGHAPNYVAVYAAGAELHNVLKDVKITGLHGQALEGVIL